MKKSIVSVVMALIFAVSVVGTSMAASVKCEVTAVDADKGTVTLTCEKAKKLKVGEKVKVKTLKKRGAVEGC